MRVELTAIAAFDGMLMLRALRRISQRSTLELSKASKISVGRLNGLERGLVEPTREEAERLAAIFRVRASRLFQTIAADPAERVRPSTPPASLEVKP